MPNVQHELLPIVVQEQTHLVDARLLHQKIKSGQQFSNWIQNRIKDYGFERNKDFFAKENYLAKQGGHNRMDYFLTLDMAKELAMLERNEIGRNIRRYFIAKENELRGISQLPKEQSLFKGLKPNAINGRKLFPYREMLVRCGYKANSNGGRRHRYPQHFVLIGAVLYITEDFALHLLHQKQVYTNRIVLKAMQPVLPYNFGEHESNGGVA